LNNVKLSIEHCSEICYVLIKHCSMEYSVLGLKKNISKLLLIVFIAFATISAQRGCEGMGPGCVGVCEPSPPTKCGTDKYDCFGKCIPKGDGCCWDIMGKFTEVCKAPNSYCCEAGGCAEDIEFCPDVISCSHYEEIDLELKPCGPICTDSEDTCCPEGAGYFSCSDKHPICCPGGPACAEGEFDDCFYPWPTSNRVTTPILITPEINAVIIQNDSNIGCPYDPDQGYGYRIFFDWTDSSSPFGIKRYGIFVSGKDISTQTLLTESLTKSEFEFIACNQFISDENLTGWEWTVIALDHLDPEEPYGLSNKSLLSEYYTFEFELCTLHDGSPCHTSNFSSAD
jgi:hypothetical protein